MEWITHRKHEPATSFQYRAPFESGQHRVDDLRPVFGTAFNFDPIAPPANVVSSEIGERKQGEATVIVGCVRVSHKRHFDGAASRRRMANGQQERPDNYDDNRSNKSSAFANSAHGRAG